MGSSSSCDLLERRNRESGISSTTASIGGEKQDSEGICCIDLERRSNIMLYPCKHVCLCQDCANMNDIKSCPVCQTSIAKKETVYIV